MDAQKTTETALGLYRMYIDCADSELEEIGCTRDDILKLARSFDTGAGIAEADIAVLAAFRFKRGAATAAPSCKR